MVGRGLVMGSWVWERGVGGLVSVVERAKPIYNYN
jgi:hypothetical protein